MGDVPCCWHICNDFEWRQKPAVVSSGVHVVPVNANASRVLDTRCFYIHSQYVWNDALHRVHERPALFSSNLNSMQYNRKCMHVQYAVGLNKLKIYYTTNKLVSTRLTVSRRSRNWAPLGPSWANHRNGTIFIARQRIIIIIFYLPWK